MCWVKSLFNENQNDKIYEQQFFICPRQLAVYSYGTVFHYLYVIVTTVAD
jgi:hypothetical protein